MQLTGFAAACHDGNSLAELAEALMRVDVDAEDCRTWALSPEQWREAVRLALAEKRGVAALPVLQAPTMEGDARRKPLPHVRLERRIVWNLMLALAAAGCAPVRVFDGGDERINTPTWLEAMEAVFAVDDATLYVYSPEPTPEGARRKAYGVRFVLGNGVDCISDWAVAEGTAFGQVLDAFDTEVFA